MTQHPQRAAQRTRLKCEPGHIGSSLRTLHLKVGVAKTLMLSLIAHSVFRPTSFRAPLRLCGPMRNLLQPFIWQRFTRSSIRLVRIFENSFAACATERTRDDVARGVHGSRGINEGNFRLSPCSNYNACRNIGTECSSNYTSCGVDAGGRVDSKRMCVMRC